MKIKELFQPPPAPPKPSVPARCPPCGSDLWREVVSGFARTGRIATADEVEEEVCRQWRLMTERSPPKLFR